MQIVCGVSELLDLMHETGFTEQFPVHFYCATYTLRVSRPQRLDPPLLVCQ